MVIVSDEAAKAVQETAKATTKALDVLDENAGPLAKMLASVATNTIALAGGDWLEHQRRRNYAALERRTRQILEDRGVDPSALLETPSPSVVAPLLAVAQDESRDELQDLFARLLANAVDPARQKFTRRQFIQVVKAMEPLDALLFRTVLAATPNSVWRKMMLAEPVNEADFRDSRRILPDLAETLGASGDAVSLALQNLQELDCLVVDEADVGPSRGILQAVSNEQKKKEHTTPLPPLPRRIVVVNLKPMGRELASALGY